MSNCSLAVFSDPIVLNRARIDDFVKPQLRRKTLSIDAIILKYFNTKSFFRWIVKYFSIFIDKECLTSY